jgi:hypothetical protein
MGHTIDLIFTDRHRTMKTVNAIVLKEEMYRKKADKQSMTTQEKVDYVNNWKKENKTFLCDALGLEDGPQCKFLTGIFISSSTSKNQVPFLQEVLQADAAHMSFGKYTLYSVYATTANATMPALGFALLFGNEDKESWMHFWQFIKKIHPIINQFNFIIITDQDKGSLLAMEDIVPLAGRFLCSFHHQQNIVKKCGGRKGHKLLSALCMFNLLIGCKSVVSLSATRKSTRKGCTPQTLTASSTLWMKCNSLPQGVLRAIQFACMAKQCLLV